MNVETNDLYFAFIGFSKRGHVVNRDESMRGVIDLHKDMSYKPKLFLFEKSEEDKQIDTEENKGKMVSCFGLAINEEAVDPRTNYRRQYNVDKYPTFVKHIFA